MRCRYCESSVPDDSLFCPICGFTLHVEKSLGSAPVKRAEAHSKGGSPGLLWYVALSLLASAFLAVTIGLGLVAAVHGLEDRQERAREVGLEYYRRGLIHLQEGNYLLALAELEEAVRLAPDYAEAREQLAAVQDLIGDRDIASSETPGEVGVTLYAQAKATYSEERWGEVIAKLEQLRRVDPSYRRQEVEEMLFNAYYREAMRLMEAGELEEALAKLDDALDLRPDDPRASEQRHWLSLYLTALTQWGVDWEQVVESLEDLHALNSDFLDVQQRLHDAYLSLGDVYSEEGAWCVAESQYVAALEIMVTEAAVAKRDDARELCVEAISATTPAADATVTATPAITSTATSPPSTLVWDYDGESTGYVETDPTAMRIRVHVINAQGEEVPGVEVGISAQGWQGDPKVTNADGFCEFAGLTQELEFTVTLTQLPCDPVQVSTRWGTEAQVMFVER